jgi:hypothetical protein
VASEKKVVINARQKALALGEAENLQHADAAYDRLQAGALVKTENAGSISDQIGIGHQLAEDKIARSAGEPGAFVVALDARAGVFDEFSVLDSGRAGSFASAAVQAFIDVIDEPIGDRQFPMLDVDHLPDAPTGRIGFEIP